MVRYIAKRLVLTLFVIVSAAIMIFTIMYFVPGDPAQILLGDGATPEDILAKRIAMGLEDPYLVRLGRYLFNVFCRFDLGESWTRTGVRVTTELLRRLPRTLFLGTMFILISSAISLPLGIMAATHQNSWPDWVGMVVAIVCASLPDFWLALMMVYLFSVRLNILPAFGIETWQCYIMPIFAGAMRGIGILARQTRSSMLEVRRADFVTTARAKGLTEKLVIIRHMLPNALIPIITLLGGNFGMSIAGTIIIEQVFSMPGIGSYISQAITARDYPVIQGCVIILAAFIAIVMLGVDLIYACVDPRIKAQYISQSRRRTRKWRKHWR
jgi:peptide/nickel transport system permease protein